MCPFLTRRGTALVDSLCSASSLNLSCPGARIASEFRMLETHGPASVYGSSVSYPTCSHTPNICMHRQVLVFHKKRKTSVKSCQRLDHWTVQGTCAWLFSCALRLNSPTHSGNRVPDHGLYPLFVPLFVPFFMHCSFARDLTPHEALCQARAAAAGHHSLPPHSFQRAFIGKNDPQIAVCVLEAL